MNPKLLQETTRRSTAELARSCLVVGRILAIQGSLVNPKDFTTKKNACVASLTCIPY